MTLAPTQANSRLEWATREKEHYDISLAVGERVLLPEVRQAEESTLIIADGFSCQSQIEQQTGRKALHLAEVLAMRREELNS